MSDTNPSPQPWVQAGEGVRRRVLAHTPDAMTVEVVFDAGCAGPPHAHPHIQTTYVRSGRFRFVVAGVAHDLAPGDGLVIPPNAEHGCEALEAGTLIDSIVPRRDDFL